MAQRNQVSFGEVQVKATFSVTGNVRIAKHLSWDAHSTTDS
jgi:hypothetical protein